MIELFFVACLAKVECRDVSLLYDPRELSLMTCTIGGQAEIARWSLGHPIWTVERWTCRFARDGERSA